MKAAHVDLVHSSGVATFHAAGVAGISLAQIMQWLAKYGLPLLLQILPIILPLLHGGVKLTMPQVVKWMNDALEAVSQGRPIPPLPVAAK